VSHSDGRMRKEGTTTYNLLLSNRSLGLDLRRGRSWGRLDDSGDRSGDDGFLNNLRDGSGGLLDDGRGNILLDLRGLSRFDNGGNRLGLDRGGSGDLSLLGLGFGGES
jgi:hypothetical protein